MGSDSGSKTVARVDISASRDPAAAATRRYESDSPPYRARRLDKSGLQVGDHCGRFGAGRVCSGLRIGVEAVASLDAELARIDVALQ
jgi:hypothetical protein